MKENEKETSDQDIEIELDNVADNIAGGTRSLKKGPFADAEIPKKAEYYKYG